MEAVQVPAGRSSFLIRSYLVNFNVYAIEWNSDGTSLVLMDKEKYCVAYLVQE